MIAQAAGRDLYEGDRLTRYYARIVVVSGLAAERYGNHAMMMAGTASSLLGMASFSAGVMAAPLAGILGPATAIRIAVTVLVTSVAATATYVLMRRP